MNAKLNIRFADNYVKCPYTYGVLVVWGRVFANGHTNITYVTATASPTLNGVGPDEKLYYSFCSFF